MPGILGDLPVATSVSRRPAAHVPRNDSHAAMVHRVPAAHTLLGYVRRGRLLCLWRPLRGVGESSIHSRPAPPGREHIRAFLAETLAGWRDLRLELAQVVAEDDREGPLHRDRDAHDCGHAHTADRQTGRDYVLGSAPIRRSGPHRADVEPDGRPRPHAPTGVAALALRLELARRIRPLRAYSRDGFARSAHSMCRTRE